MNDDHESKVEVNLTEQEVGHILAGLHAVVLVLKRAEANITWTNIIELCTYRGKNKLLSDGEIDELRERLKAAPPAKVRTPVSKEMLDRLHRWGDRDETYRSYENSFLDVYDQKDEFFGERFFYDPETRKMYRTWLKLEIEAVDRTRLKLEIEAVDPDEGADEETCPCCGEDLADATDIPDDVICDVCGWSRSGIRRCIRCGTRDKLVPDDAVCPKCRAPDPGMKRT